MKGQPVDLTVSNGTLVYSLWIAFALINFALKILAALCIVKI